MLLLASFASMAATTDSATPPERNWTLGVSLGYGQRSNPLVGADDLDMVAVVDLSWYGKRWFFDNGDLGFTLEDNEYLTINSVVRLNGDRLYFEHANSLVVSFVDGANSGGDSNNGGDIPSGEGNDGETPTDDRDKFKQIRYDLPDRNIAVEAGIELLTDGDWGFLNIGAYSDISDAHQGYQFEVGYGYSYLWNRWVFSGSLDLNWKSDKLNNYYYGVLQSESNKTFSAYEASSGLNASARVLARYYLTKHLSAAALLEYETLSSAIADSPFVDDSGVATAYMGIKYNF